MIANTKTFDNLPNTPSGNLGAPIAEFGGAPRRGLARTLGLILLIGGEAAAFVGLFSPYFFDVDLSALIILIGGGIALVGLLFLIRGVTYRQARVTIFTDGLERSQGALSQTVLWWDIEGIWQAVTKHYTNFVYTGTTHTYTLQLKDGKKVVFNDSIKKVEQLGDLLQKKIIESHLPTVVEKYNMGTTIGFGPVGVSQIGIVKGQQLIPWNEVESVALEKGFLQVKKVGSRGNAMNVSVSTIPNLFILLTLIDRIKGLKRT